MYFIGRVTLCFANNSSSEQNRFKKKYWAWGSEIQYRDVKSDSKTFSCDKQL